ncbi:hypothetical protein CC85DRAFT_300748 [Cutaneotrichosporon oleaginosum]|uniref:Uncharacterized protein n=1 Tax=Cutaneotrichosporon oleaginosum TaxID=879819 RepID=A0A0J0XSL9_9TREE|nr:uncharacterized protein CC85DRAFT_300748 [Cutaneotrichosporon oleaginosum]KLT44067.1 hypothetical protein CC85DRAFT_300748 [Cutaneotrichosporon oleaginosum]TXT09477.1 hypothetical protein COLE_03411 [Cutaneotrichosporon oleaginosum]
MAIELPDPSAALLSADGQTLWAPGALVATWDLPAGSRTACGVFLPFPAHALKLAITILTLSPTHVYVDAETARTLVALEAYGVPVLNALLDANSPPAISYTLLAVRNIMADKTNEGYNTDRFRPSPPLPHAVPTWCRLVLEERAPHALRALDA